MESNQILSVSASPDLEKRGLQRRELDQSSVHRMVRRRLFQAGIRSRAGNHSFRATGITNYLKNGGKLELAQQMAAHASPPDKLCI